MTKAGILLSVLLAAVCLGGLGGYALNRLSAAEEQIVAYIAREPVTLAEFRFHMQSYRAEVFAYFHQKYGAEDHPNFWRQAYGEEVPIERLRKMTLDKIIYVKLIYLEACDQDLLDDPSFSGFTKRWKDENDRRKEAMKHGRVIYGPQQLSERQFYEIELSNLESDLKKKLSENNSFTELQLKNYYKQNLPVFEKGGFKTIERISLTYTDTDKAEAKMKMTELRRQIEAEGAVELLKDRDGLLPLEVEQWQMDKTKDQELAMLHPAQYEAVQLLSPNQVSELIEEDQRFILLQVVDQTEGEQLPFDQVREAIKAELVEALYQEKMDELNKNAPIDIVREVYESVDAGP